MSALTIKPTAVARCAQVLLGLLAAACHEDGAAEPVDAGASPLDAQTSDAAAANDADLMGDAQPTRVERPLIDQTQWRIYDPALDPLRDHQPAELDCLPPGWFVERGMLEVSTADCNYLVLEHPALLALSEGDEVLVELWHFDLSAPEPAQAHAAFLFGDQLQWQTWYDIPQPGNVHQISFQATRAVAVDEPIRFHLHNHGQNTWLLASMHALVQR